VRFTNERRQFNPQGELTPIAIRATFLPVPNLREPPFICGAYLRFRTNRSVLSKHYLDSGIFLIKLEITKARVEGYNKDIVEIIA
jgi:hypothetical protein